MWGLPAFLPIREEGVLRNFIVLKNPSPWPISNSQTSGPVASTLITTPPRRPGYCYWTMLLLHTNQWKERLIISWRLVCCSLFASVSFLRERYAVNEAKSMRYAVRRKYEAWFRIFSRTPALIYISSYIFISPFAIVSFFSVFTVQTCNTQ
jgi:hypothetical protein